MSSNVTQQSVRESKVVSDQEPATHIEDKTLAIDHLHSSAFHLLDDGEDNGGAGLEVDGFVILPLEPKTKEDALAQTEARSAASQSNASQSNVKAPKRGSPSLVNVVRSALTVSPWWDDEPTVYPRPHNENEYKTTTATTGNDEPHDPRHSPEPPSPAALIRQIEDAMAPMPDSTNPELPISHRPRLTLKIAAVPAITAVASAAVAHARAQAQAQAQDEHVRNLTDSITAFVARSGHAYRSSSPASSQSSSSSWADTSSPPQSPALFPAAAAFPTSSVEERNDGDDDSSETGGEWFVTAPEEPSEFDHFEYSVDTRGRSRGIGLGIELGPRESALVAERAADMRRMRGVVAETGDLHEERARSRGQRRRPATGRW